LTFRTYTYKNISIGDVLKKNSTIIIGENFEGETPNLTALC